MFVPSDCLALFDDNLDRAGDLLLTDLEQSLQCDTVADLPRFFGALEAARARGQWVALAAHYELGHALEPRLSALLPGGIPLARAWVFRKAERLSARDSQARLDAEFATLDEHRAAAGVAALQRNLAEKDYLAAVERIREWIAAGDCYQVNYTFALTGQIFGSPLALYRRLRHAQPVRHGALIRHAQGAILSRSPELFVERRGPRLTCRPMKGTAARTTDPAALAASQKNRAENVMIVDLIRNDLGRLAPPGGVRVAQLCRIEGYPSVWQMTSTIHAEPVHATLQDMFRALFPCGSVTGAPKIRAMEIIRSLEREPRGLYCGALGWIAPDGDFRFSVPIRTLDVDAGGRFRMGLGSGIVADSEAVAEFEECLLKGRFLSSLRPPFGLIETLRCETAGARRYPLLPRHLRRLSASAAHFGIACDVPALRARLDAFAAPLTTPHRVRVELRPDGTVELTGSPLGDEGAGSERIVVLSRETVDSRDPLLRHKTTARARYDRALREATAAGHFDVLFFNERGELTEGARSNVFLDLGEDVLVTPALDCGLLDGVYRRKLLDEGLARERRLSRADLAGAKRLFLTNALRGLLPARLADGDQWAQEPCPH